MRKLIWKIRYAICMNDVAGVGWKHSWYLAGVAVEEADWKFSHPIDAAHDEVSYWNE